MRRVRKYKGAWSSGTLRRKLPGSLLTYWHQGFEQAPPIVRACLAQLRALHPESHIQVHDECTVRGIVEDIPLPSAVWSQLSLAHRSDLIRTKLLLDHGGVWADPTVFFTHPIEAWLGDKMDAGLFLFHRPGRDRLISNWLIAAEPDNPLLRRLFDCLCSYWRDYDFKNMSEPASLRARVATRVLGCNVWLPRLWLRPSVVRCLKTAPYMIYHYMFYDLITSDAGCAEVWNRMPKVSAIPPHRLQRLGLFSPLTDEARQTIDVPDTPVFKLTWKLPQDEIPAGTVVDYLLDKNRHSYPQAKRFGPA